MTAPGKAAHLSSAGQASPLETVTLLVSADTLRRRAAKGRDVAFRCNFYELPAAAQDALFGIAAELESIADDLDRLVSLASLR